MSHTPYGYRIENGTACIDENEAAVIRSLYKNYLSGMALRAAAEKAGLTTYHGTAAQQKGSCRTATTSETISTLPSLTGRPLMQRRMKSQKEPDSFDGLTEPQLRRLRIFRRNSS